MSPSSVTGAEVIYIKLRRVNQHERMHTQVNIAVDVTLDYESETPSYSRSNVSSPSFPFGEIRSQVPP